MIPLFEKSIRVGGELVLGSHLPGEPEQNTVDPLTIDSLLASYHTLDAVRIGLPCWNIEGVRDRLVYCEESCRIKKPQLVFLDRSTESEVDVAVQSNLIDSTDA